MYLKKKLYYLITLLLVFKCPHLCITVPTNTTNQHHHPNHCLMSTTRKVYRLLEALVMVHIGQIWISNPLVSITCELVNFLAGRSYHIIMTHSSALCPPPSDISVVMNSWHLSSRSSWILQFCLQPNKELLFENVVKPKKLPLKPGKVDLVPLVFLLA